MKPFVRMTPDIRTALSKNNRWFLVWGVFLVLIGSLAISYSTFTTLASIILLGTLILLGGVVMLMDTLFFWRGKGSGFYWHLLLGLLYLLAGISLITSPVLASVSLTLFLGIFYLIVGSFRLVYATCYELPGRSLRILNGIVSLLLGLLILASWPASGLFIIGLFIGIDILMVGLVYIFGYTFV